MHVDILFDLNRERSGTGRQPPPLLPFDQHPRRAVNEHRSDIAQSPHRDSGRSTFESNPSIGGRSGAFGKNDQVTPATHSRDAILDYLDSIIVVANISSGTNRSKGERVAPKCALHNAISVL